MASSSAPAPVSGSSGGPSSSSAATPPTPSLLSSLLDGDKWAKAVREWPTWALKRAKVVAHIGFVPFVIAVGMLTTEPRPHILQLIGP